jgi:hypothetical protein
MTIPNKYFYTVPTFGGFIPNTTVNDPFGPIGWNPPDIQEEFFVQEKVVCGNTEGYNCISCQQFFPMAELNLPKDKSYKTKFECYSCRNGLSIK